MSRRPFRLPAFFREEDPRITAPMIRWWIIFALFGIIVLLVATQTVLITEALSTRVGALISLLGCYLIFVCVILAGILWLVWRQVAGKPLRRIARAARKVAQGDFDAQIPIPRRKKRLNEIDVLIEDFNTMARELAGNEMLKSDFIANVSHELKAPLSLIQSYTKALRDGAYPPGQETQYMNTVLAATERLNRMITNILKLSKLENQQIFPAQSTYQLGEQLRRCALGFWEQWEAKGIAFDIDVADVAVHVDAALLELVWDNLLSNATKFTDPGGHIRLRSAVTGGAVQVVVEDTGCGMDAETCRRVFEKFYQGDTSHAAEGNGLGLALAKKIVDISGGRIWAESQPGTGSRFWVELPLAPAEA